MQCMMLTGFWGRYRSNKDENIRCYYGCKLESLKKYEDTQVPEIIFKITERLDAHLHTECLYRKPGNKEQVSRLQRMYPSKIQLDRIDIHDLASWLKTFLIDLDEPLLPKRIFENFKSDASESRIKDDIMGLTEVRRQTFEHVMKHLLKVIAEREKNKMTKDNICVVWAPVLYYPLENLSDAVKCIEFFRTLVDIYDQQTNRSEFEDNQNELKTKSEVTEKEEAKEDQTKSEVTAKEDQE